MSVSGNRFACLYVPDFSVAVALRALPYEPEGGLAILAESDSGPRVTASSRGARLDGVRLGMSPSAALAVAPEVVMLKQASLALDAAQVEIERSVRSLCPSLSSSDGGTIYLNFSGMERRYVAHGELGFLDDLQLAVADLQLPVRAGMADTRFAARAAALLYAESGLQYVLGEPGEAHRVCPGVSREFLAPLPLSLLPRAAIERHLLHRLGIRTLGQLAALHSSSLRRRLGARGLELQALARGRDVTVWRSSDAERRFRASCESDHSVTGSRGLRALFKRALAQVLESLRRGSLAAARMRWLLELRGCSRQGSVAISSRSTNETLWLRLISRAVDQVELSGPVHAVHVEALEIGSHIHRQTQLPGPRGLVSGAASDTLERLRSELGCRGFGRTFLHTSTRPEDRQSLDPELSKQTSSASKNLFVKRAQRSAMSLVDGALPGQLPRAFRAALPPEPIALELRDGRPHRLRWRDSAVLVERSLGPWDISSQWWHRFPLRRRYFQLQAPGLLAQVYWIPAQNHWFLSGWWD
jgi:protein ImuB